MPSLPMQVARAIFDGVSDSDYTWGRRCLIVGGFTASGLRLTAGMVVGELGARPEHLLRLWDCEGDPGARSVREAMSILDLDAEIRPCPLGGARFRVELGEEALTRLEDPNVGTSVSGSSAIVGHLHRHYGTGRAPALLNFGPVEIVSGAVVRFLTGGRGRVARRSAAPAQPLELWSFEASPYCRFAREALGELELPYVLHNVAKGSPRRAAYVAMSGAMRVPYLHDPNTGERMFESLRIEEYLQSTYGRTDG